LSRAIQFRGQRNFTGNENCAEHTASGKVCYRILKGVKPGLIKLDLNSSSCMSRQLEYLAIAIARQVRKMEVLVVVLEFERELPDVRHHNDRWFPQEMSVRYVNRDVHHSVRSVNGMTQSTLREELANYFLVLVVDIRQLIDERDHSRVEQSQDARAKECDIVAADAGEKQTGSEESASKIGHRHPAVPS
jgi:hypothetical protein